MRALFLSACCFLGSLAFAQGDRGTITGTVADPAGAVVANAPIEARNAETGALFQAASSATGNYTLSQLPTGTYELSLTLPGFKKYVRQNIALGVAQTLRIDIGLEVGAATESVTVTEAVALLKTESGELSHNVASQTLNQLPVLPIGAAAGTAGIRNPAAVTQLLPGTSYQGNALIRVNGAQGNTASFRIEGQDASNGFLSSLNQQTQPSVDSIQEISVQTSNFAAEYGQVGGGYFNLTMKSGTNQFHGSAYDYFVNEALNAGQPFTDNGRGGLIRPVQRRNDYGFTLGGPVSVPKLYNGHDRTFFFFNLEQYRENQNINNQAITVPTPAYRLGDFREALTGRTLATDPLSRPILEGTIYDPATQRLAPNGQTIRDAFPLNTVPLAQEDSVALNIQKMIPLPTIRGQVVNNGIYPYVSDRVTSIPAVKLDHSLSTKAKLSGYWSRTSTESAFAPGSANADGLRIPITQARGTYIYSQTERVNFDYSLTPSMLLHLGAGYTDDDFHAPAPISNYDAEKELGLRGAPVKVRQFPNFRNLTAARGGMKDMGPNGNTGSVTDNYMSKPTATVSLTWVKNNHTFKTGAEMRLEGYIGRLYTNATGSFTFSGDQTGLPSTQGQNLSGGTVGFPYASFLIGAVNTVNVTDPINFRLGKQQWGMFAQDTWKVTRKLTLDYGLRYDYQTYLREQYGRVLNFSTATLNPTVGLPGAVIFEGSGPGRCGCNFAQNYPLALAPRLGVAYQITSKTVLRAGWGIVYASTQDGNGAVNTLPVTSPTSAPSFGDPVMYLRNGIPIPPEKYRWPNFDPGQFPQGTALNAPPVAIDQNAGRPARQWQWSIGLQREVLRDLVVEAAYVGNRGVWWNSPGLIDVNALTAQRLASFGLDPNNANDRTLLAARLDSTTAIQRGFGKPVYNGFPLSTQVAQALRPFPQFGTITYWWSPIGKSWYDSLQVKATKRFSYGLSFTSVFTWQKNLGLGSASNPLAGTVGASQQNDVFNRDINKYLTQYDQPFLFNTSVNYAVPKFDIGKALSWTLRDWTIGGFFAYGRGLPIRVPAAQNALASVFFRGTFANRVPGEPLFIQDLNCHCFDPNKAFVLNPKAWAEPAAGQWGTSAAYYGDYRTQRRPLESLAFGRTFRVHERVTFNIRAEFTNLFNRTQINNPTSTNARATQVTSAAGKNTAGFGWIDTSSVAAPPRQGTIVARFNF